MVSDGLEGLGATREIISFSTVSTMAITGMMAVSTMSTIGGTTMLTMSAITGSVTGGTREGVIGSGHSVVIGVGSVIGSGSFVITHSQILASISTTIASITGSVIIGNGSVG